MLAPAKAKPASRVLALLILAAGSLAAQDSPSVSVPATPPSSQAGIVRLWVTALEKGRPVTDLRKDDIGLFIGNAPQTISSLSSNPPEARSVWVLVDNSASRRHELPGVEAEFGEKFFGQALRPGDQGYVAAFNDRFFLIAGPTGSPADLERALLRVSSVTPVGGTALFDAMYTPCSHKDPAAGRHILVVVSDGGEDSSHHPWRDVLTRLEDSKCVSYFVLIGSRQGGFDSRGGELANVARTGGMLFKVSDKVSMGQAFDLIGEIVNTQYALDFQPTTARSDDNKHRIRIKCLRSGVKIVAPEAY
jgi:Ca-activated chloride channel family protein